MCIRDRRLQAGRSGTNAIEAAPKLGAHAWLGHLRRERNVHVLIDIGAQARLANINEESFTGPAPAA
eukprot:6299625-Alexandrium_andersonii.AAC.1